jgi:outer membrane protein TolC
MLAMWWIMAAHAAVPDRFVEQLVAAALANDPVMVAATADVERADGELRAASGLRQNPTLDARFGLGLQQHEASLRQPLSVTGAGAAAFGVARARQEAAVSTLFRRRLEVAADIRRWLVEAIRAEAALTLSGESLQIAKTLRASAEARLSAGDGTELEVHLARLEEAAAVDELLQATNQALEARVVLAAHAALPADAELPTDPWVAVPPRPGVTSPERHDLLAANAAVLAAKHAVRFEAASVVPPIEVGVWAQAQNVGVVGDPVAIPPMSGNTAWTVGPTVSVTLPAWQSNADGRARARAALSTASAEAGVIEATAAAERFGVGRQRDAIAAATGLPDPTAEARAALSGIDRGFRGGEFGVGDASAMRARVLETWRRGASTTADAAKLAIAGALAEEWPSLLSGDPAP